jgi:hypothetical protein
VDLSASRSGRGLSDCRLTGENGENNRDGDGAKQCGQGHGYRGGGDKKLTITEQPCATMTPLTIPEVAPNISVAKFER